jgi:uncharacterized protein YggE
MHKVFIFSLAIFLLAFQPYALGQSNSARDSAIPVLTVRGSGEVSAAPDQALVQLGTAARSERAADAQQQVNRVVGAILKAIKAAGIPAENISTTELTLLPVFERTNGSSAEQASLPRIIGYSATNIVRVEIHEINKIGDVIDAGIGAGANRLEGLSFELKDDTLFRQKALQQAVLNARQKAEAIVDALNLRLVRILAITEEGIQTLRPQFRVQRMVSAAAETTPVEPGRIQVSASVVMDYQIENSAAPAAN